MESYEVICVNKPAADSTYDKITAIGYQAHTGKSYIIKKEEAIRMIEEKEAEFWVQCGNLEVALQVKDLDGQKHLWIPLDNHQKDQLTCLRECKPMKV